MHTMISQRGTGDEGEFSPPQAKGNMTGNRRNGMEGQVMFALKYGPLTVNKGPLH